MNYQKSYVQLFFMGNQAVSLAFAIQIFVFFLTW
jgi:hypothetical protein